MAPPSEQIYIPTFDNFFGSHVKNLFSIFKINLKIVFRLSRVVLAIVTGYSLFTTCVRFWSVGAIPWVMMLCVLLCEALVLDRSVQYRVEKY